MVDWGILNNDGDTNAIHTLFIQRLYGDNTWTSSHLNHHQVQSH